MKPLLVALQRYITLCAFLTLIACSSPPEREPTPAQAVQPPVSQPSATQQPVSPPRYYEVRAGDTLYSIAKRHGVPPEQLQAFNRISDPTELSIGQRLQIPRTGDTKKSRFIWPVRRIDISSGFGARPGHKGVDLRAPRGTEIRAAAGGVVHFVGIQRGYGKMLVIRHDSTFKTLYAHNLHNRVVKGQRVEQGQVIATVGNTGNATGYHVHFEVIVNDIAVDPLRYMGN